MIGRRIDVLKYAIKEGISDKLVLIGDKITDIKKMINEREGETPEEIYDEVKKYMRTDLSEVNDKFFIDIYYTMRYGMEDISDVYENNVIQRIDDFTMKTSGRKYEINFIEKLNMYRMQLNADERYIAKMGEEIEDLEELNRIIDEESFIKKPEHLSEIEKMKFIQTDEILDTIKIRFNHNIKYGEELEFFNSIILSEDIPVVKYGKYIKIYKTEYDDQTKTKLKKIIEGFKSQTQTKKNIEKSKNLIILLKSKKKYEILELNTSNGILSIDYNIVKSISIEEIIKILNKSTYYKFDSYAIERMKKNFSITDIRIDPIIYTDIITNTPILSKYISIDESQDILAEKSLEKFRIDIGDRNVKINISRTKKVNVKILGSIIKFPKERIVSVYLLTGIKRDDEVIDMIKIIKKILSLYRENYDKIKRDYSILDLNIPNKEDMFKVVRGRELKIQDYNRKLWDIKSKPKNIKVIPEGVLMQLEDELEELKSRKNYKRETVSKIEELEKRINNIVYFPAPIINGIESQNPDEAYSLQHFYEPTNGFMQIKLNKGKNKALFPYILGTSEKAIGPNFIQNDDFTIKLKINKKTRNNISKASAQPDTKNYASADEFVKNILGDNVYRYGSYKTFSSFLHCIAMVMDNSPIYHKNPEKYIRELREELSEKAYITRQETYNIPISKVKRMIEDPFTFFDSKLFYRLAELKFNINIFVIELNDYISQFEIPNYSSFHSRQKLDAKTIILNRIDDEYSIYTTSKSSKFNPKHALFDTDKIFDIYTKKYSVVEYSNHKNITKKNITIPVDIDINGWNQVGQKLDGRGKCQVLVLNKDRYYFSLHIPPSYVRDLPLIDPINNTPQHILPSLDFPLYHPYTSFNNDRYILTLTDAIRTFLDMLSYFGDVEFEIKNTTYSLVQYPYFIPYITNLYDAHEFISSKIHGFIENGKVLVKDLFTKRRLQQYTQKKIATLNNLNTKYLSLSDFTSYSKYEFITDDINFALDILYFQYINESKKITSVDRTTLLRHGVFNFILQPSFTLNSAKNILYNWNNFKINTASETSNEPNDMPANVQKIDVVSITEPKTIIESSDNFISVLPL